MAEPIKVGDRIAHKLLRGFSMEVLAVEPCEVAAGQEPHDSYKIIDPEGAEDWLCAHDVVRVP